MTKNEKESNKGKLEREKRNERNEILSNISEKDEITIMNTIFKSKDPVNSYGKNPIGKYK